MNSPAPDSSELPEPEHSSSNTIFIGPDGLRPGWRAFLFAMLVATLVLMGMFVLPLLVQMPKSDILPLSYAFAVESLQFLAVLIATAIASRAEDRPLTAYGYQGQRRLSLMGYGLVSGIAAISLLTLGMCKAGLLTVAGNPQIHGASAVGFGAGWALMFLLVALFEESALRGYMQFTLTRGIGFGWSALLLSGLFGLSHVSNSGESLIGLCSAAGIGLVFCMSLWYTGSLWWAVGFHMAWDWGESFLFGTADSGLVVQGSLLRSTPKGAALWSGGSTGPEGSVLILPAVGMVALLVWLTWRRQASPFGASPWKPAPAPAISRFE